ncbi:MAG: stage 0 sporulation family protein [Cytophagales bacterium]
MGCGSCSSGGCSTGGGCGKSGGCSTGGCNKLNTFDWLSGMVEVSPADRFPFVEVRFKGGRKEILKNANALELHTGDAIIVDSVSGQDIGHVALQGELVGLQMKKKGITESPEMLLISRIATKEELLKHENVKLRELPTMYRTREIVSELKLEMKISDIEFQLDGKKATFYYSAEDRVDFRELIKRLATEFKVRIEMKQISLRQEASRLGGIGVCGRELCCSTWLTDFKSVNTSAARYQNLSLNPQKLSGQCGRLKCCLNYELDTYMLALKDVPEVQSPLQTQIGSASLQKTDIFRKLMWFSYSGESNWHQLSTVEVEEIIALNKKGVKPNTLNPKDLFENTTAKAPVKLNNDIQKLDDRLRSKNRPSSNLKPNNPNFKKRR